MNTPSSSLSLRWGGLTTAALGLALLSGCAPQSGSTFQGPQRAVSAPTYPPLTGVAAYPARPGVGAPAVAAPTVVQAGGPAAGVRGFAVAHLGNRLTSTEGRTLYVYDRDPQGQSACVGDCARIWPPYLVEPGAAAGGQTSTIQRSDGQLQWAVQGRALYLYAGDQAAHQALGEGLEAGSWHSVPYPVPAGLGAQQASSTIPPFPGSSEGLPVYYGSGSK